MLQEFLPERRPKETLGTGTSVCFQCEDALALYREFKSRGIKTGKPTVGNRLWVVPLTDPDGYRIEFESPTDAPQESELDEKPPGSLGWQAGHLRLYGGWTARGAAPLVRRKRADSCCKRNGLKKGRS